MPETASTIDPRLQEMLVERVEEVIRRAAEEADGGFLLRGVDAPHHLAWEIARRLSDPTTEKAGTSLLAAAVEQVLDTCLYGTTAVSYVTVQGSNYRVEIKPVVREEAECAVI